MPPIRREFEITRQMRKPLKIALFVIIFSGIKIKPMILGGASDSRYLRRVCIKSENNFESYVNKMTM